MTTITVDNRVRVPLEGLSEDLVQRLRRSCTHTNPDFAKQRAMGRFYTKIEPEIKTWRTEGKTLTLPSGAMARVRAAFKEANVPFKLRDLRSEGLMMSARRPLAYVGHKLRPYQVEMVDKAYERERCVIRAATGSGKTTAAFALCAKIGLNCLVVLPNAKLLKQWEKRALHDLGLKPNQIGIIRGAKRTLRPITLATQQTLWSRDIDEELQEFFGAVLVDEGHHAAARTFMHTLDAFPARYRIAFTADERRKDRKEFIVYDLIGDVACEVSREDCEAVGAIVDVDIRVVMTEFRFDSYRFDPDFNALLDGMVNDEKRNKIALDIAMKEIKDNEQVIMLTHRREHARDIDRALLARNVTSGCLLGAQEAGDEEEFEEMCVKLNDGTARAGVGTYQALGEGIDLPAVGVGVAMTPIATNKQMFNQVRGRLCRISPETGKSCGRLYVLFDRCIFDERILRNIVSWNRTVHVRVDNEWIVGKEFLKRHRKSA